jgi:putative MATE family efflux protein
VPQPTFLTDGPVPLVLRRMAIPMAFGLLLSGSFSLVEAFLVSFLGDLALAALGLALPLITIVINVFMGLGIGITTGVAMSLGGGRISAAITTARHAVVLGLLLGVLVSLLGILMQETLLRLLGADAKGIEYAKEYLAVWFLGAPFVAFNNVGTAMLRGAGDTKSTAVSIVVTCLVNVALAPLLILGLGVFPRLGMTGAALSSIAGFAAGSAYLLRQLLRSPVQLLARSDATHRFRDSVKGIVLVAVPSSAAQILRALGFAALTAIVARFGTEAQAAMTVYNRVSLLILMVPTALSASLIPFIGQNVAAQRRDRAREAVIVAWRFALGFGLVAWLGLALASHALAMAFTETPQVAAVTATFLQLAPAALPALALVIIAGSAFIGSGRAPRATHIAAVGQLLLGVPIALALARYGLIGVLLGYAGGQALSAFLAHYWLREGLLAPVVPNPSAAVVA